MFWFATERFRSVVRRSAAGLESCEQAPYSCGALCLTASLEGCERGLQFSPSFQIALERHEHNAAANTRKIGERGVTSAAQHLYCDRELVGGRVGLVTSLER